MKVITTPEVKSYLNELITILYQKGYFSYEETAKEYVDELLDEIIISLPKRTKKPARNFFTSRFGKGLYYAVFPKSKRTQWYVFFKIYQENNELIYQVRYIENNHVISQHLR